MCFNDDADPTISGLEASHGPGNSQQTFKALTGYGYEFVLWSCVSPIIRSRSSSYLALWPSERYVHDILNRSCISSQNADFDRPLGMFGLRDENENTHTTTILFDSSSPAQRNSLPEVLKGGLTSFGKESWIIEVTPWSLSIARLEQVYWHIFLSIR